MSYLAVSSPGQPKTTSRAIPAGFAYALVAVVGVTVLLVSAYYLWRLALLVGMPGWLAWTLPVALDAGAAGATVCWVGAAGAARAWGRGLAIGALGATVAGNALSHLIEAGLVEVTPLLVIVIGAVYPAVLWAMVHLALVLTAEQAVGSAESSSEVSVMDREPSSPRTAPSVDVSGADDASPRRTLRHRGSTADDRRRWIASQLAAGHQVTGGEVERRFASRNGAREVAQVEGCAAGRCERCRCGVMSQLVARDDQLG